MKGVGALGIILILCGIASAFPSEMEGYWQGIPEVTPLGPWNSLFNFTILPIENTSNQWLMSDFFEENGTIIPGSEQQWWVEDGVGITYCGLIYNFFRVPNTVISNYTENISTSTEIQWCQDDCDDISWTLTLLDSDTLSSHFYFSNPVNHLIVTLNRIDAKGARDSIDMPPPCNFTIPIPYTELDEVEAFMSDETFSEPGLGGCPFKHLHQTEEIPDVVTEWKTRALPHKFDEEYEFCYILNEAVEYAIAWNFLQDQQTLQVAISVPSDVPHETYVGFGFMPYFPGMIGADIALGYFDSSNPNGSCVRSMYAEYYVGAPVDSTSMELFDTDVVVEDNRVTVQFSRPFDTGHHNITITDPPPPLQPGVYGFQTMWAVGAPPADCTSSPNYHGDNRGYRVIDFMNPSSIFPDFMKCNFQ